MKFRTLMTRESYANCVCLKGMWCKRPHVSYVPDLSADSARIKVTSSLTLHSVKDNGFAGDKMRSFALSASVTESLRPKVTKASTRVTKMNPQTGEKEESLEVERTPPGVKAEKIREQKVLEALARGLLHQVVEREARAKEVLLQASDREELVP